MNCVVLRQCFPDLSGYKMMKGIRKTTMFHSRSSLRVLFIRKVDIIFESHSQVLLLMLSASHLSSTDALGWWAA